MRQYDVKCPICGHMNYNLYLEETDGWMECENCGSTTNANHDENMTHVPVFSLKQLTELARACV